MIPPLITVGSSPAVSSSAPMIEVVVVLPCVPAIAIDHLSRISSASISARRTTGRARPPPPAPPRDAFRIVRFDRRRHDDDLSRIEVLCAVADHDANAELGEPLGIG